MKKNQKISKSIYVLLFILTVQLGFSQKALKNPAYEVSTSGIYHISKIERSKTETRVHIHSTFIPKWWVDFNKDLFLKDCDSGKKYTVTGIEGGAFGEKLWMPASGEDDFVLLFPPLDKGVKKIDYGEFIYGVSLTKKQRKKKTSLPKEVTKWMDTEFEKVTNAPIKDYNSPEFFKKEKAKLIGYIKGYDPRLGFETGIMYIGNEITNEDYPIVVQIHDDGRFEAELPLTNPVYTYMSLNKALVKFYLEPGQTTAVILDWEEFLLADRYRNKRHKFKDIQFKGPLAATNQDLMNFDLSKVVKEFDYKSFQKKIKELAPETYKKGETTSYQNNLASFSAYLEKNTITDKAKVLLENKLYLDYATHLFDFESRRKYEARNDTINAILKIPVEDAYYDFIAEVDLNDQSLLVLGGFSTFVNRFEFSKPMLVYPKRKSSSFKPEILFVDFLKAEKIELTARDKELMKNSKNKIFKSLEELKEHKSKYSDTYNKGYKAYNEKYIKPFIATRPKPGMEITAMEKWRLRDSVVENTFHLEKNLVYDLVKIRALDYDIKRSTSEDAHAYWEELKKDIDHPFLREEGARITHKIFPISTMQQKGLDGKMVTVPNIKPSVVKLPDGRATDIFKKILDPYNGKIVFVDFWATSCGPCVGGIKRMKETRKKHEGNTEFDFVFITEERASPIKTYNKLVKEQNLKNIYRLSSDDYNYLRQLFKFNGIPRYVVIDKKGDVINGNFPMYSFDSKLDGILEKYK